jgi:hypothetical protein
MRRSKKEKEKQSVWQFTREQIGRGLRTAYSTPENLPPRLRTLVTQLEHKVKDHRGRNRQRDEGK